MDKTKLKLLENNLFEFGFDIRGFFKIDHNDDLFKNFKLNDNFGILIGNHGDDIWDNFSKSFEFVNNIENPLDNWCKKILLNILNGYDSNNIYFPSDKPYLPFQSLAMKCDDVIQTKFNTLLHKKYGSWHAYRAIICFENFKDFEISNNEFINNYDDNICINGLCPADAFYNNVYDVKKCSDFVYENKDKDCYNNGCIIRQRYNNGLIKYSKYHNQFYFDQLLKKYKNN